MHILVCSPSWPTTKTIDFIFVDQLSRAFADLGCKVTVIAPQSITKCIMRHIPVAKLHSFYKTSNGNTIEIFRPSYISMGNTGSKLLKNSFQNAVKRAFRSMGAPPDVCYGHFWKSIFSLYPLAKANNIPLFGASGEEDVGFYIHETDEFKKEVQDYVSGVVSVSSKNQKECLDLNLVDSNKSIVIPNAIDQTLFLKMDKGQCRKEFGIASYGSCLAFFLCMLYCPQSFHRYR